MAMFNSYVKLPEGRGNRLNAEQSSTTVTSLLTSIRTSNGELSQLMKVTQLHPSKIGQCRTQKDPKSAPQNFFEPHPVFSPSAGIHGRIPSSSNFRFPLNRASMSSALMPLAMTKASKFPSSAQRVYTSSIKLIMSVKQCHLHHPPVITI